MRGVAARVAAADPAVLPERQLLALQENFAVAIDGDEGAVGAVVLEHPLVLAALDGAVLARRLLVVDHEVAAFLAPQGDRIALAPAAELALAVLEAQDRRDRASRGPSARHRRGVALLVPQQLAQHHLLRLALDLDRVERARPGAKERP